jgi:hypothetical protein
MVRYGLIVLWLLAGCPDGGGKGTTTGGNGGSCQTACLTGMSCTQTELARVDTAPVFSALVIDASGIYWASEPSGSIAHLDLDGGNPTFLVSGEAQPGSLVVDQTNVYWATGDNAVDPNPNGTIRKVTKSGGSAVVLANGQAGPGALAVDATSLFWLDGSGGRPGVLSKIMKLDLASNNTTTLVDKLDTALGLAIDDANVYWSDGINIMAVSKSGGTPKKIAAAPVSAANYGPLLSGSNVYWLTQDASNHNILWMAPIAGGAATQVASTSTGFSGIAVGCDSVYWGLDGTIMRQKGTDAPITLTSGIGNLADISVDDKTVYWLVGNLVISKLQ